MPTHVNLHNLRDCAMARTSRSFSSSSSDLVLTNVNEETGVASLVMNRLPVNSLSLEMCQAISNGIKEIEATKKAQALVLSSASKAVFSAGIDLTEMYNPDPERLSSFWNAIQQVYLDLYGSRLACIAAIEGHAPAAGCMLTLACDYRIISATDGKHRPTIGLNEAQFGIVAPSWLAEMMALTIGQREAEKALALGTLFSPDEALRIKLVDEVVSQEYVLSKAEQEAIKWAKIPPQARVASKMLMRQKHLQHLLSNRQEDIDSFVGFITSDRVQGALGFYLESLKKKSKV